MLNEAEGAHIKNMSTFATNEHLLLPCLPSLGQMELTDIALNQCH
jgi:hypothetical protein